MRDTLPTSDMNLWLFQTALSLVEFDWNDKSVCFIVLKRRSSNTYKNNSGMFEMIISGAFELPVKHEH